jgi:signal transduction histidine kinase
MKNADIEKPGNIRNPLREKLVIIEALVFLVPILVVGYIYYQKQISFETNHIFIFLAVLFLILGGMVILRQIFDRILMVQTLIKKAEQGEQYALDVKKDTGELHEITKSFNNLVKNLEESNSELQRRIAEIDERKQMEAALKRAKEEAEASNIAKSRFLANMSHELRTPLNAIIGFSQVLLGQAHGELNEKQSKYLNNMLESGNQLLNMVEGILNFVKIESGEVELQLSSADVLSELRAIAGKIQESADKKGLSFSIDFQPDLPKVDIDCEKFRQIVSNLLDNAIKFTPEGGKICVTANLAQNSKLEALEARGLFQSSAFSFEPNQNWVMISVQDSGIGLKPEDQEKIFSIFEQVDASQKRKFGGTGFGLAMSRKLVELHQGHLWVESEGEGKGSRFSFLLPLP